MAITATGAFGRVGQAILFIFPHLSALSFLAIRGFLR